MTIIFRCGSPPWILEIHSLEIYVMKSLLILIWISQKVFIFNPYFEVEISSDSVWCISYLYIFVNVILLYKFHMHCCLPFKNYARFDFVILFFLYCYCPLSLIHYFIKKNKDASSLHILKLSIILHIYIYSFCLCRLVTWWEKMKKLMRSALLQQKVLMQTAVVGRVNRARAYITNMLPVVSLSLPISKIILIRKAWKCLEFWKYNENSQSEQSWLDELYWWAWEHWHQYRY